MADEPIKDVMFQSGDGVILYAMVEPRPANLRPPDMTANPPFPGDPFDPLVYSLGYENPTGIPHVLRVYDSQGNETLVKTLGGNKSEITYSIPEARRPKRSTANLSITRDVNAIRLKK